MKANTINRYVSIFSIKSIGNSDSLNKNDDINEIDTVLTTEKHDSSSVNRIKNEPVVSHFLKNTENRQQISPEKEIKPSDNLNKDNDFLISDTLNSKKKRNSKNNSFLTQVIKSKNTDSMILDLKINKLFLYNEAVVDYGANTLNADIIEIDLKTNNLFAKGTIDTATNEYNKTIFKDQEIEYNLDSIAFNLKSEKGKIYGVVFNDDEGYVHGQNVKKSGDTMNIKKGRYTTCDLEHPHFYLASVKAQYVTSKDSKKIIIGPSYLVIEDVPLPLAIPFGFFPIMSDRSSGIIIPSIGEENIKGFFLKDGGYYQVINDNWDASLVGGIYTLGSWDLRLASTYAVRYKFKGNFSFDFSNDKIGEEGTPSFQDMQNYKLAWTHTQDSKARPGSNFSALVNFSTSGYNKYDGDLNDYTESQTNSSISYSKTWIGTPFSFSTNIQHSQNMRDSSIVLSLPNFVFNVSKIYPFKRRNAVGAQKWYEKISFSYTNTFNNTLNFKENELFEKNMFDNMKYGMKHTLPVSTSLNIFKFISVSPSFNYNERWYFEKLDKNWNPETEQIVTDTISGFNRVYDYNAGVSLSTTIYGMFNFINKNSHIKAIRHVITPSIGFSYAPNYGEPLFGYYKTVQSDSDGNLRTYSPYENGIFGVPGRSETAAINFSLNNNLEMKVKSNKDSTGVEKITIFDALNFNSSYNFVADSMKLAPISITARTTLFKSLAITLSAQWDPYIYTVDGIRTKHFAWSNGNAGRITNFSASMGYSFRHTFGLKDGTGSASTAPTPIEDPLQGSGMMGGPSRDEQLLANALQNAIYYDFSVPWNLSFNYMFRLSYTGRSKDIIQTLSINGGLNLTPKWAITFSGGFDFARYELTPVTVSIVRDLHCWQMSLNLVPMGFRRSFTFNINVKSSVLQDLKLKKTSNFLDNYYDTF